MPSHGHRARFWTSFRPFTKKHTSEVAVVHPVDIPSDESRRISDNDMDIAAAILVPSNNRGECAVCMDEYHVRACAFFVDGQGTRTCAHYFHEDCATTLRDTSTIHGRRCPLCRTPFSEVKAVPSLTGDARGWFMCADVEDNGRLGIKEVAEVLPTVAAVDLPGLEATLPQLFRRWDLDGSGLITPEEAEVPGALLDFARRLSRAGTRPPLFEEATAAGALAARPATTPGPSEQRRWMPPGEPSARETQIQWLNSLLEAENISPPLAGELSAAVAQAIVSPIDVASTDSEPWEQPTRRPQWELSGDGRWVRASSSDAFAGRRREELVARQQRESSAVSVVDVRAMALAFGALHMPPTASTFASAAQSMSTTRWALEGARWVRVTINDASRAMTATQDHEEHTMRRPQWELMGNGMWVRRQL